MNAANLTLRTIDNESMSSANASMISPTEQLILTISLVVIVLGGVIGNSIVVIVMLVSREHRKTPTNRVVFYLAIADLLFIVCCAPFQGSIYILTDWKFGRFVCKSVHCMQYATMLASILILTIMSIERYVALKHPFKIKRYSTVFVTNLISGVIWISSFVASLPWIVLYDIHVINFGAAQQVTVCYDYWGELYYLRKWYMLFFFVTGFAIPAVIISIMSGLTATAILRHSTNAVPERCRHEGNHLRRNNSQTARRRRVTGVIFAVAILFLICWFPHNIAIIWINFGTYGYTKAGFVFRILTHIFTYINSVINPFLYALLSDNFKGIFSRLIKRCDSHQTSSRRRIEPNRCNGNVRRVRSTLPSENAALTAILREISLLIHKFELQQQQYKVAITPVNSSTTSQQYPETKKSQTCLKYQNQLEHPYTCKH